MSSVPPDPGRLSLMLSEVLSDVGINTKMILKRRNTSLFKEAIIAVNKLSETNGSSNTMYNFGSQSEGSTTIGIDSDIDGLMCMNTCHVIHDRKDWKCGVQNLLVVRDKNTAAGYCHLQLLRNDAPRAFTFIPPFVAHCMHKDRKRRVLVKNTLFANTYNRLGLFQHGPAVAPEERPDLIDTVSVSGWPTAELKLESEHAGCFLVPVGSKTRNGLDELEWRISTSMAERYMMFSLNVTQMGCYVLIKMLLKSKPVFQNVISSYMCKTALFHSIESTESDFWQECNLVRCLNHALHVLYTYIDELKCPHFIIPENNLMAERITEDQRGNLLEELQQIIASEGGVFYDVTIDNIGERLRLKENDITSFPRHIWSPDYLRRFVSGELCYNLVECLTGLHARALEGCTDNIKDALHTFQSYYAKCKQKKASSTSTLEQEAIDCTMPLCCSTIGSVLASQDIAMGRVLSDTALEWLNLGLNSDVSSGLLKLATVHYSVGDIHKAELILQQVDQAYDKHVTPIWFSHSKQRILSEEYMNAADQIPVTETRNIVSFCVMFLHCEGNIVPLELRQEYFRSTQEDMPFRNQIHDYWMDLAVVDSLPYLHFLQYKTYGRLNKREEQQRALRNLQQVLRDEENLGHTETALNLVGQCMEQENEPNEALHYYEQSLEFRPRNNAANIHKFRLNAELTSV